MCHTRFHTTRHSAGYKEGAGVPYREQPPPRPLAWSAIESWGPGDGRSSGSTSESRAMKCLACIIIPAAHHAHPRPPPHGHRTFHEWEHRRTVHSQA